MKIFANSFTKRRSMGSTVSDIQAKALSDYNGHIIIMDPKGELADKMTGNKQESCYFLERFLMVKRIQKGDRKGNWLIN